MCVYSQTTYVCKHNIETLTELCELGRDYKPSMHDKVIIGIHESAQKCKACGGPDVLIDLTNSETIPIDLTNSRNSPIDLTEAENLRIRTPSPSKKRARKDSGILDDLRPQDAHGPVGSHPNPMDTSPWEIVSEIDMRSWKSHALRRYQIKILNSTPTPSNRTRNLSTVSSWCARQSGRSRSSIEEEESRGNMW